MRFAIIKGGSIAVVTANEPKINGALYAESLKRLNDADQVIAITDDAHEATLRNEAATIASFLAEIEGMSIAAMTAAQQRKLLAIVCRRLGIRVRP